MHVLFFFPSFALKGLGIYSPGPLPLYTGHLMVRREQLPGAQRWKPHDEDGRASLPAWTTVLWPAKEETSPFTLLESLCLVAVAGGVGCLWFWGQLSL